METKHFTPRDLAVRFVLGVISSGAGAFHGYCDAQGIPLKRGVEPALIYGPAVVQATLGVAHGWAESAKPEMKELVLEDVVHNHDRMQQILSPTKLKMGLITSGMVSYGIRGGLDTLLGYAIGYFATKALL